MSYEYKYYKYKMKYLNINKLKGNDKPIICLNNSIQEGGEGDACDKGYNIIMKDNSYFYVHKNNNEIDYIHITSNKSLKNAVIDYIKTGAKFKTPPKDDKISFYEINKINCQYLIGLDGNYFSVESKPNLTPNEVAMTGTFDSNTNKSAELKKFLNIDAILNNNKIENPDVFPGSNPITSTKPAEIQPVIPTLNNKPKHDFLPSLSDKYSGFIIYNNENEYEKNEDQIGYDNEQAFVGDNAYNNLKSSNVFDKFCKNPGIIPTKQSNSYRILSYNLHNFHSVCKSKDSKELPNIRKQYQRIIKFIAVVKPDVALFQEMVPYASKSGDIILLSNSNSKQTNILVNFKGFDTEMANLGFEYSIKSNDFQFSHNYFMGKGTYVNKTVDLISYDSRSLKTDKNNTNQENRGYIRTLIKFKTHTVLIYNVHLSFSRRHREPEREMKELLKVINSEKTYHKTNNVVIMGDFNNDPDNDQDMFPFEWKSEFDLLKQTQEPTYTSMVQSPNGKMIDLIYVSKGFEKIFDVVNKHKYAYRADQSDHYPMILDIREK